MSGSDGDIRPITRRPPEVGDHRRGPRLRTTPAGTWFVGHDPAGRPAGLLLVHPGVNRPRLVAVLERLGPLDLPGVIPARPALVDQAGRHWMVASGPVAPTLLDLLAPDPAIGGDQPPDGPRPQDSHRTPGNAVAVLLDVASTLLTAREHGLTHGGLGPWAVVIGPDGVARITDWGTVATSNVATSNVATSNVATSNVATSDPTDDDRAWAEMARSLAGRWCTGDAAQALERAASAATGSDGLAEACRQLRAQHDTTQHDTARRDTADDTPDDPVARDALSRRARDRYAAAECGEIRPGPAIPRPSGNDLPAVPVPNQASPRPTAGGRHARRPAAMSTANPHGDPPSGPGLAEPHAATRPSMMLALAVAVLLLAGLVELIVLTGSP